MRFFCFAIATLHCDSALINTINSILTQSIDMSSLEIVIVFGDSKAESDFINNYLPDLDSAHLVNFKTGFDSLGVYSAFNHCIALATASYITFLGAGDLIASNAYHFLKQLQLLNLNVDIIVSALTVDGFPYYTPNFTYFLLPPHQSIAYRLKTITTENHCYDTRLRVYGDSVFSKHFFQFSKSMIAFKSPLINYATGGLGSSMSLHARLVRIRDLFRVFLLYKFSFKGFCGFIYHSCSQLIHFKSLL